MPSRLDQAFAALSDPTRRAIVSRLARRPARVTDVAGRFPMSLNAVSKHLKVLEGAGLIKRRRAGREHHLELRPAPLHEIARWTLRYERFWNEKLDAPGGIPGRGGLRCPRPSPPPASSRLLPSACS